MTRDNTLLIAAASALAGASLLWALQKVVPNRKHVIPRDLLNKQYSAELAMAVTMALQAGKNMVLHCDSKGMGKNYRKRISASTPRAKQKTLRLPLICGMKRLYPMLFAVSFSLMKSLAKNQLVRESSQL